MRPRHRRHHRAGSRPGALDPTRDPRPQDGERQAHDPIHPLIRPGFLAYASGIDHERLFPELSLDSRGRFSDSFQKWFSRYLSKVGARAPRTSYHSFRHGFRDRLREAHVSDELVDALMGWTRRTMRETYGSGPRISALAEVVERVEYPGLDLGDLYVR